MKKSIWVLALLWILVLSWCGSSVDVVEYNDSFVALVKECTDANKALFQNFHADWSTVDSIMETLQNNITICQNSQKKASSLWNYDKDSSLKDWVIDLLSTEVEYLQKFWNTSRYWNIDNITEEDKLAYDGIVGELYQLEPVLNSKFVALQEIQELFAAKHGLKLK